MISLVFKIVLIYAILLLKMLRLKVSKLFDILHEQDFLDWTCVEELKLGPIERW